MIGDEEWLTVGKIVAPQGLRGEIRIQPFSDFPERFTQPGKRWLRKKEEKPNEVELIGGRSLPGKTIFVVRFEGINMRSQAESLVGKNLLVPTSQRPKLEKNEFHFLDLLGLEARLKPNEPPIGQVTDLTNAGNDLLEIKLMEGKKILIPFVEPIVPLVNIEEGWLLINPPPGLLEL